MISTVLRRQPTPAGSAFTRPVRLNEVLTESGAVRRRDDGTAVGTQDVALLRDGLGVVVHSDHVGYKLFD